MKTLFVLLSIIAPSAYGSLQVAPKIPVASAVANQFVTAISAGGVVTQAQPDFSNLSGSATTSQLPVAAQAQTATGNVFMTAATSCPSGSISADGSSLLRSGGTSCGGGACAALFTAISTTYGSADGTHFTLPNMKGVFPRGAGSQTISAITYTGTQGTTAGDQFQGHFHQRNATNVNEYPPTDAGTFQYQNALTGGTLLTAQTKTNVPVSDGSNGTPRTGSETRPANITLLYCIVY